MSKIYLHVGIQKTASTYLQEIVFPSARELCYVGRPYTQENRAFNSLQYGDESLFDQDELNREIAKIKKRAKERPTLISDELFSGYAFWGFSNRGSVASRLARCIPEAEIILFIRNQPDLVCSLYNQYVKIGWYNGLMDKAFMHAEGDGFSYKEWVEGRREWDWSRRKFNIRSLFAPSIFKYTEIIGMYKKYFKKVHVFLYEDFKDNKREQLERLESILSVRFEGLEISGNAKINTRLSDENLHLRRLESKLVSAVGSFSSKPKLVRGLARVLVPLMKKQTKSEIRSYAEKILTESGVFHDNSKLVERFSDEVPKLTQRYYRV